MKVILAGYNVDTEALKTYKNKDVILTPESISAAYARISRSSKPVDVLRQEARREVEKARSSNRKIIFEMGHHSVAEHAVFNLDIIGISRRAVEELEQFRLCSYTEKSQRYVALKGDYVIPKELDDKKLINEYRAMIRLQNGLYKDLFQKISEYNFRKFSDYAKNRKTKRRLENLAKEDARYVLSLATQTQLGATINARNLELMIRRCASHQLNEMNILGRKFFSLAKKVAPSVILFYGVNDYDLKTYPELRVYADSISLEHANTRAEKDVTLLDVTPEADTRVLASLLFRSTNRSYVDCEKTVKKMSKKERLELFKKSCRYMELYDVILREFEYAQVTFCLIVSAACFGQLKRHRIATMTNQGYDPSLGYTVPVSVRDVGMIEEFSAVMEKTERLYRRIKKKFPGICDYILTNAHRKRVLLNVNLRELYHISRLREDPTAQWDIRDKVQKMSKLARKAMPITSQLLGGKTDYARMYYELFGFSPKVTEVPEPG